MNDLFLEQLDDQNLSAELNQANKQIELLEKENGTLRSDLAMFDAQFFDEIEQVRC